MSEVKQITEHTFAAAAPDGAVYTLSNRVDDGFSSVMVGAGGSDWEQLPMSVCGVRVVPYGPDNNLPARLRDILDANNLAPGILERQAGLLFGQGVYLCRTMFEDGKIVKKWTDSPEITRWLDSWDYISYIKGCLTDYLHLKGFFTAHYLTKGSRLGGPRHLAYLEHIPAGNARLEWTDTGRLDGVKHIAVGDFERYCVGSGVRVYPVYDRTDPGRYAASASYRRTVSFGRNFYSVPSYWGALRWIVRGSEIPAIFKYVTDNGINLAYHIQAPKEYWDAKRLTLQTLHPDWSDLRLEEEISKLTAELLENLTKVLSGKENAGKFFYTVDMPSDTGSGRVTWSIAAIDQKIKDFIESQLKISEASTSAITSGMGLHPSLSNVMVNGKLASGSELLYAFKLFLLSDTQIASDTVLEPINEAIAFNFPGTGLKLAFYHKQMEAEESLTSSARVKNQ